MMPNQLQLLYVWRCVCVDSADFSEQECFCESGALDFASQQMGAVAVGQLLQYTLIHAVEMRRTVELNAQEKNPKY